MVPLDGAGAAGGRLVPLARLPLCTPPRRRLQLGVALLLRRNDYHTDRLWKEFDVVGAVLWTVRSAQGDGIIPGGGEWDHESGRFAYFEYVVPLLEGKYADARLSAGQARASWRSRGDADGVSPRVFDLRQE